jgi:surface antigen
VYQAQNRLLRHLKRHKTLYFLQLFRKYAALAAVLGSAFLVTGTNMIAEAKQDGLLAGYFRSEFGGVSWKRTLSSPEGQKDNLSVVPLAFASAKVDPNEKDTVFSVADMTNDVSGDARIVASSMGMMKDPEENGGVKLYTVREGDTLSAIAARNLITLNTILWANDIEDVDDIKPGDALFILPLSGLTHVVAEGETVDSIATKYRADRDRIIAFNELPATGEVRTDQEIVIPDGQKDIPKPLPTVADTLRRQYATASGDGVATDISSGWKKLEGKAGAGHRFPYGYCTWYVSQKRYVPWGGNAGTWLYNAKSQGYKTGKKAAVGSIVVTTDSPYYGHVALVESVSAGSVTVSEMNYKGWGKVNKRVIPTNSRSIKGYIY